MQSGRFLNQLRDCQLLKNDSALWYMYEIIGARMSLYLKLVVKTACLLFYLTVTYILKATRSNLEWDATLSSMRFIIVILGEL